MDSRPSPDSDPHHRARVAGAFFCLYFVWGTNFLAIRWMVETIPPLLAMGVRSLLAGGILYLWAQVRGAPAPSAQEWGWALLVGAFLFLGAHGALAWGERRVVSGTAALVMATIPIWMVLFDWLGGRGQRPSALVWLGLLAGAGGMVVLTGPAALLGGRSDGAGLLVLALSAPCWAAGSIIARRLPLAGSSLSQTTGMQLMAGGTLLVLASWGIGELRGFHLSLVTLRSVAALSYTIAFGSVLTLTAYTWLLRVSTPARVSTYAYINPLIAVVIGWAVAGEPITGRTAIAAGLILAGVALIISRRD